MHITCLGLNHTTTTLDLRERLAFSEENLHAILARLGCGGWRAIAELVIVSTCNRIELYAVSSAVIFTELEILLSEEQGIRREDLHSHLYRYKDLEAARHLFEVAAGLDSLVIGEPQILGQVTRALELARGQAAAGPLLNRLFLAAIKAGKRVRTETAISRNPASVASLAVGLAEKSVPNIAAAQIVTLGAGEMIELVVETLRKRRGARIRVVNRTLERAKALADRWQAEPATFETIEESLALADVLISSTGAPHILITTEMVQKAMKVRPERPLVLIDIAVPRDIDSYAGQIPGVSVFDIDNLNARLEQSLAEREAQVPQVRSILSEELEKFGIYLKSLEMLPLIADMHQTAEQIRLAELGKTLRRLPDLTEAERARIDALTLALVKKLLENPTRRLRAEATCPHAPEYASVARTLFGLEGDAGLCGFSGGACPLSTAAD
jgi:glutamyl-tRNA reductase